MKPDYKLVAKAKYIHNTADLASEPVSYTHLTLPTNSLV